MTSTDEATQTPPRPGSTQDLVRRIERMEEKHDDLAREVSGLTGTVARVELNQKHAEELNELRFASLNTAVGTVGTKLDAFMSRIEGIITGEVDTVQARQGAALVADYQAWRKDMDTWRDTVDARENRRGGMVDTLRGTKGIILMICAIASPLVAAVGIILTRP